METEQKKETKKSGVGMKILLGLMVLMVGSLAFAGVVTYLSNTATANVSVSSPMTIQFASVGDAHLNDADNHTTELNYTSGWENNLNLAGITGLDTIDLGVKVVNNSEVAITGKTLVVTVSNNLNNVSVNDITSLKFYDIGASIGSLNRDWQELAGPAGTVGSAGLAVAHPDGTVTYTIPINSLAAGTTYKYPVTMTYGVVEEADYNVTATLMN